MGNIEISFDDEQLSEIEKLLGSLSKKAPNAARSAINRTMTEAKKMLEKHIKDNYNLPPKKVSAAFSRTTASQKDLNASITIKGEPLELREFKPVNSGNQGVLVKVKKNEAYKKFMPKLFWADLPAGENKHHAIMQRSASGKQYKKEPFKTIRASQKMDTTKIKKLIGPSIPGMVWGEGGAFESLRPNVQLMLQKHIDEAVKNLLDNANK